ncbi:MAG: T9SS type A sorting domain-containing protein, partial [Bacteroidetes bacterium]|nr:T9SS type A sorting domain-containing protein [Bacteroidota bacterium]
ITTPASPTSTITGLGAGTNTFRWTISSPPCGESFDEVVITQSGSITTANAGADQNLCTSTTTLAGNAPFVGTGSWSLVTGSGTITSPSNSNSGVTALGIGANTFRWTISSANCSPSTDDVIITVKTQLMANAGPDQNVCTTSITLAGNNPSPGSGLWSIVSGAGTITAPTSQTSTVTNLGTGYNVFRWTISNNPCASASDDVTIMRSGTITTSNAGVDQTVCGTSATLAGNTATIGTGTWTRISGSGIITTASSPTSTVTGLGAGANVFRWNITNGNCPPSTDDVTITSVSFPTTANAGPDQSICATTTTLTANTPSIGTGLWSLISGSGIFTTPTDPGTSVTGLGNGINVFRWTISNGSCTPSTSDVTVINCGTLTTGAISGSPFCQTTSYNVNVPFIFSGSLTGPFIAQLSDTSGSFALPVTIGYSNTAPVAATIPSGTITGTKYRIRVRDYGTGVNGQDNGNDLSINTCGVIGIDEFEKDKLISIYPNPSNGSFNIVFNKNFEKNFSIEIESIIGKCLVKQEYSFLNQNEPISFDIPNATKGIYFLKMQTPQGLIVKRILVE